MKGKRRGGSGEEEGGVGWGGGCGSQPPFSAGYA